MPRGRVACDHTTKAVVPTWLVMAPARARALAPTLLLLLHPGRVPSGHARPAALQAFRSQRFLHRPALCAAASRRHHRTRPVARRHLSLHRKAWRKSRRLHAVPGHRGTSGPRTAALRHLLRSLPLPHRRWQRRDSRAWFSAQAALLSHRASAQGAPGIFLRRDHQRLRLHARLLIANHAAGSLGDCGLHPRSAVEPGSHRRRRSRGTESPLRSAALRRTGFGRNIAGHRNQARTPHSAQEEPK